MDPTMPCTSSGGIPHSRGGPGHCRLARSEIGGFGGSPPAHGDVQWPPGRSLLFVEQSQPGKPASRDTEISCRGGSVPKSAGRNGPVESASPQANLEEVCGCRGNPGVMLRSTAIRPHWKWREGVLYPVESAGEPSAAGGRLTRAGDWLGVELLSERARQSTACSSGGPPKTQIRHREVDVGCWPRGAPIQSRRHPERSEGSAICDQILRTWETVLRMTKSLGSGPPWLAVQNREVDVGCIRSGLSQKKHRHPERSEPARRTCTRMAGGGSARLDQILRVCETTLRMTEGFGNGPPWLAEPLVGRSAASTTGCSPPVLNCQLSTRNWQLGRGGPPWLAVQHREVDIGHRPRGAPTRSESHPERSEGSDIPVKDPNLAAGKTSVRMTQNIAEI